MAERRLTVSRTYQPQGHSRWNLVAPKEVPFVRLRGQWLEEVGFPVGARLRVEVAPGRLVLTPAADEVAEASAMDLPGQGAAARGPGSGAHGGAGSRTPQSGRRRRRR
jgi:Toxin SymE, type I toxin-antitoxin system